MLAFLRHLPAFIAGVAHTASPASPQKLCAFPQRGPIFCMRNDPPAPRRSSRARKPHPLLEDTPSPSPSPVKRARKSGFSRAAQHQKNTPLNEESQLEKKSMPEKPVESMDAKPSAQALVLPEEAGPPRPWGAVDDARVLKVVTWNVSSLRSLVKAGLLLPYIKRECPDVLCLQETKMTPEAEEGFPDVDDYSIYWNHSEVKKGYSGVAVLVREDLAGKKGGIQLREVKRGMGVTDADAEGRVLSCYFDNGLVLVNAYVPNSGGKLARLGFRTETFELGMRKFLNQLAKDYSVLYCGDLNVAHMPIDIHNSKGNQKSAGHTPQERHQFSVLLESGAGWKDTFRELFPEAHGYTYFSRRFGPRLKMEGKGWRLDYHVVDAASFEKGVVGDVYIRTDVEGSDHYPLIIEYKL